MALDARTVRCTMRSAALAICTCPHVGAAPGAPRLFPQGRGPPRPGAPRAPTSGPGEAPRAESGHPREGRAHERPGDNREQGFRGACVAGGSLAGRHIRVAGAQYVPRDPHPTPHANPLEIARGNYGQQRCYVYALHDTPHNTPSHKRPMEG